MKVLLTGAFGNIGESTLIALLERDYSVTCLDLDTKDNRETWRKYKKQSELATIWGDIQDKEILKDAVDGMDCIIHLAGIIPPKSEENPELAKSVNIGGTMNVISAAEDQSLKPLLLFASSVSVFGPKMHLPPPRRADEPISATDVYTGTKVSCEQAIKSSSLQWAILRLAASPPIEVDTNSAASLMFESPPNQRVEFVHHRDVGVAFANAVSADVAGKVLLIGGGKDSQLLAKEFYGGFMKAMGLDPLPDNAFKNPQTPEDYYYTDWLDTEESQRLLQYQSRTYGDYLKELQDSIGVRRHLFRLVRGQAAKRILADSPYYTESDD
ncbi:MAG: NAD-dependent epimerase/dehydratase family protein [Candidatus Thorarchaeota archaeon]|jgi:nucleoside-diphosphate-sugar epimerase